ncbi:hypothetical protein BDQ17DRAFT_1425959 [Cyathus striatus]|nr:hypothetical protein BDQ17DRAFT_1425959 [Cyathus striatus]
MASDSCELVSVVVKAVQLAQERGSIEEELDLLHNVRQLIDTLTSIDNFTRNEAKRNVVSRFILHQSDLGKIEGYRRRLQRSLDIFGVVTIQYFDQRQSSPHHEETGRDFEDPLAKELEPRKSPMEGPYQEPRDSESRSPACSQRAPIDNFVQFILSFKNFNLMSSNSNVNFTAASEGINSTVDSGIYEGGSGALEMVEYICLLVYIALSLYLS